MENSHFSIISASPDETMAAGERIGSLLRRGCVVALTGCLGAGKTCLTKGIARALGVQDPVTSPTYTIISEYEGRVPFYHIDAYRLRGDDDFAGIGGEELLYGEGVSVIEWSERIPGSIPEDALVVGIEIMEDQRRQIRVRGRGT
jgi:tRNA threonylcarbamoyladenosine biosynthesis protein TsaE